MFILRIILFIFIYIFFSILILFFLHRNRFREGFQDSIDNGQIHYENISDDENMYEFTDNYQDVETENGEEEVQLKYDNIVSYCGNQQYPYSTENTYQTLSSNNNLNCKPRCKWECSKPECDQICKPECKQSKCFTKCSQLGKPVCKINCQKKNCRTKCSNDESSKTCSSPNCFTICDKPQCVVNCTKPKPKCVTECDKPLCIWNCQKPNNCPKPQCKLICNKD